MSKNRKDGKYIKPEDSIHAIMPYLFKNRTEAEVYMKAEFDVTKLVEYVDKLNKESDYPITYFHAFTTAIAKVIYNRPLLNRFVAGRRMYERNKVTFSFVAKNKFEDNAQERLIILDAYKSMNLDKISKFIQDKVSKTRKEGTNDINDTLKFVTSFPRFITKAIVRFFYFLDYHGLVPSSIADTDSNYATVLLSNLGSIKSASCYHHLNNYGTNSIVATIGEIHKINYLTETGKVKEKTIVDMSFTLDERIADGFYFAKSIKLLEYIINNPELLNDEISKEVNYEN